MLTIRIYAKQVEKKDGSGKFWSYSTKKGNEYINVKATMECTGLPREKGYFKVTGDKECFSYQEKSEHRKLATIWVRGNVTSVRDVDYEAKVRELKNKKLDDLVSDQLFD